MVSNFNLVFTLWWVKKLFVKAAETVGVIYGDSL